MKSKPVLPVDELWESNDERSWRFALDRYWEMESAQKNLDLERRMDALNPGRVKLLDEDEWYRFLHDEYFPWKFTQANFLAANRRRLERSNRDQLYEIKNRLFEFSPENTEEGLKIAEAIPGLSTAGASGLLAILFPEKFATVDQFVVKALRQIKTLDQINQIQTMNPKGLTISDGVVLIGILRNKARENNSRFTTNFWTPRKIDMILWTYGRNGD